MSERDRSPRRSPGRKRRLCRSCNRLIPSNCDQELCCCCSKRCINSFFKCRKCGRRCCVYLRADMTCCCKNANDIWKCVACYNITIQRQRWLQVYLRQALECDMPILESFWCASLANWHSFVSHPHYDDLCLDLQVLSGYLDPNTLDCYGPLCATSIFYRMLSSLLTEGKVDPEKDRDLISSYIDTNVSILIQVLRIPTQWKKIRRYPDLPFLGDLLKMINNLKIPIDQDNISELSNLVG